MLRGASPRIRRPSDNDTILYYWGIGQNGDKKLKNVSHPQPRDSRERVCSSTSQNELSANLLIFVLWRRFRAHKGHILFRDCNVSIHINPHCPRSKSDLNSLRGTHTILLRLINVWEKRIKCLLIGRFSKTTIIASSNKNNNSNNLIYNVVIHSLVGILFKIVFDIYLNIGLDWVHLTCNHIHLKTKQANALTAKVSLQASNKLERQDCKVFNQQNKHTSLYTYT